MTPRFSLATATTADVMRVFGGVSPVTGRGVFAGGRHRNARDIEQFLQSAGFTRREARAFISDGFKAVADTPPEGQLSADELHAIADGFRMFSAALRGEYHG